MEKTKKVDFVLDFCSLDAISLRGKEDNKKKIKELENKLFLKNFSTFLSLQQFLLLLKFLLLFFLSFALDFLDIGKQGG